jgi:hypothetical protein
MLLLLSTCMYCVIHSHVKRDAFVRSIRLLTPSCIPRFSNEKTLCFVLRLSNILLQELAGPAVSALRRATAKVKQHWSVFGWATKNLLSRASPCFGRHVKPLVPDAFALVSTHQPALGPRGGLCPVLLMCNP